MPNAMRWTFMPESMTGFFSTVETKAFALKMPDSGVLSEIRFNAN